MGNVSAEQYAVLSPVLTVLQYKMMRISLQRSDCKVVVGLMVLLFEYMVLYQPFFNKAYTGWVNDEREA